MSLKDEYTLSDAIKGQLIKWEKEWCQVIEVTTCPQEKILWQGKIEAIRRAIVSLSECVDNHEWQHDSLPKLVNKLYDLELKVEVEQQLTVKQRQNEKIVFNQGLLEGIRQMRLFVLALKYPMVSAKNKKQ